MGDPGSGGRARHGRIERARVALRIRCARIARGRTDDAGGTGARMGRLSLPERLIDPNSPDRRPRRAAYALPTLFTAGNALLGFLAILKSFQGALLAASGQLGHSPHFEVAAKAIGVAVFLDGLDGRIARMTNTTSDFGREMDSLADVVTFGVAPAVLAVSWGVQFVDGTTSAFVADHLRQMGYFI